MPLDWIPSLSVEYFKKKSPHEIFSAAVYESFGWWFSYFWQEAKGNGSTEEIKSLMSFLYANPGVALPVGTRPGPPADRLYHAGLKGAIDTPLVEGNFSDRIKRIILIKCLKMGFTAMPTASMVNVKPGDGEPLDTKTYFKHQIEYKTATGGRIPVCLAFRGDSRDFETVMAHKGSESRIDLKMSNTDKAWHPFNDPILGSKMYFRKTAGDNCLYSVSSVAGDLEVSVGFPLIEDHQIYDVSPTPLKQWSAEEARTAKTPGGNLKSLVLVRVRLAGNKMGYFLGSESSLYMIKVMGEAAHTENFLGGKSQCKERGVRGVRMQDFIVGLRLQRVHLGPTRGHGVYAKVVKRAGYVGGDAWVDNPSFKMVADAHFNADIKAAKAYKKLYEAELSRDAVLHGEQITGPKLQVDAIDKWDVPYDEFHRDTQDRNKTFTYMLTEY